ncbi:hypothetical protein [Pelagicoccus sp. SDUM812003]|uniref:hypothetical protein n=1 Tax=Pelagicoccus sp. SDUM812003 TaxID=3041267 RepID=UPI00280FC7B8|nr:hypothetical protein [Pelagicoccus sp. SDUM812003]MDQ8205109.1 hypothetical protein [Pelagicoccus sp. SDUM812003]
MPDNQGKYSLDELLRAKRQERPSPEFWASFDRELKSKQRLLIQKQLVHETRRKGPSAAYLFRFGAFAATCGAAAFAVYLNLDTAQKDVESEQQLVAKTATPTFTVATARESVKKAPIGLQEFSTLAQSAAPKVVVAPVSTVAQSKSTPQQVATAIETIAQLEETIRGNRVSSEPSAFDLASVQSFFDNEYTLQDDSSNQDIWSFEQAYLLGKYADPLSGTLGTQSNSFPRINGTVDHVSFSQLDEAISTQASRRDRSLEALTVRF